MRQLLLAGFVVCSFLGIAQTGVNGGITMIKGFGTPKAYPGIHLGVEIPRDDQVSYFGRITGTLSNKNDNVRTVNVEAIDPTTTFPSAKTIDYETKMNYTNIEGGTRYYFGNGYDYGWSAYGGSMFMLSINTVRAKFGDYDQSLYKLPDGFTDKGRIIGLNLGLNAGVKNHFSFGMLYFDMTLAYSLYAIPSNSLAAGQSSANGGLFTPLTFSFNLGFRKDLY